MNSLTPLESHVAQKMGVADLNLSVDAAKSLIANLIAAALRFTDDVPTATVAAWVNSRVDLPVLNEDQEQQLFVSAIDAIRTVLRSWSV